MNKELDVLKIKRDKKFGVGKKMGNQLWFHKEYAKEIIGKELYSEFISQFKNAFEFEVIRWEEKKNEIAFIESVDFLNSKEPLVGRVQRIQKENNEFIFGKLMNQQKDPLIYHHKWLFVKDDFVGFSVEQSKKRSIEWKSVAGVDRQLSSKIGRLSFWDNWINENKLNKRVDDDLNNILCSAQNQKKQTHKNKNKNGIK